MATMLHLLDQTPEQLNKWLAQNGLPGYRAGQVWRWIFERRANAFDAMTDLPQSLRVKLAEQFQIDTSRTVAHQRSKDGTEKLLLELPDSHKIECVLLCNDRHHRTVCISTQVGCAMGCVFCASGLDGMVRNLTTGEMVEQILKLARRLPDDERISHIVVMGMGEPLLNIERLLPALDMAARKDGLGISSRRITISTVGLPEGIRQLAKIGCSYQLAVSLHAADDALRNRLVPSNRKTRIEEILAATDEYFTATGRRVTFEYVLLAELNDHLEQARGLAALLRERNALVNLIPFNPIRELPYRPPSPTVVARFVDVLRDAGLTVKIRYRKGDRIDAACGQLRLATREPK